MKQMNLLWLFGGLGICLRCTLKDESYIGPLEFQIKTLQRQIEAKQNECLELQQYWLRQQSELVKVLREVTEQTTDVESKKKQSTILLQKKLRVEGRRRVRLCV